MELDKIYLGDCLEGMRQLPDNCIDLCLLDPPYSLSNATGAGAFGRAGRKYHSEIDHLQTGVSNEVLEECLRVCKKPNMYIFCSKDQLPQLLNFAVSHKLTYDLLCWHKTNPVPTCHNKYLSDTEYIVFMRKGASLYGTYETKRKYFITKCNVEDKKKWGHPTMKPVLILKTLINNALLPPPNPDFIVLDPYMGSGSTAIAAIRSGVHFLGWEINPDYYKTALSRIELEGKQLELF